MHLVSLLWCPVKRFSLFYLFMCVCVYVYAVCVLAQRPEEDFGCSGVELQGLETTPCEFWELNSLNGQATSPAPLKNFCKASKQGVVGLDLHGGCIFQLTVQRTNSRKENGGLGTPSVALD